MERPRVCGYDCYTNTVIDREMTDEEYAQWQEEQENAPTIPTADSPTDAE